MQKLIMDFYQQYAENAYYHNYLIDGNLVLINNNDLVHSQDKYNRIMNVLYNYYGKILKTNYTNGINIDFNMQFNYFTDTNIAVEFLTSNQNFLNTLSINKIVVHCDGYVFEYEIKNKSLFKFDEDMDILYLLVFTVQNNNIKSDILKLNIDSEFLINEINFKMSDIKIDTQKVFDAFFSKINLMPNDSHYEQLHTSDSYYEQLHKLYKYIILNKSEFSNFIESTISNIQNVNLEVVTNSYLNQQENKRKIFNAIKDLLQISYPLDTIYDIETQNNEYGELLFEKVVDKNFFYIGNKTNFDAYILNNDLGVVYILPLFYVLQNKVEMFIKEVIVSDNEVVGEQYKPYNIIFATVIKLIDNIYYKI